MRIGKTYLGIGLVGNFDKKYHELGLKILLNPTFKAFHFSRKVSLLPFLFIQANWKTQRKIENKQSLNSMNFRPGIGINGNVWTSGPITVKPSLQVGYTVWDKFGDISKGLTVEFRIGIGLQTWKFRKIEASARSHAISF